MIRIWFLMAMAMAIFAQWGYSQGTLAPLYVFTNGDGTITPYQSGQMLEVGQTYDLTATPDFGYEFSSWEPVDVSVITQTNYIRDEPILPPVVSMKDRKDIYPVRKTSVWVLRTMLAILRVRSCDTWIR
jgi:hypothetical protein